MTDSVTIRESDIITSATPPAGIQIPALFHEIYDEIKASEGAKGMAGGYLTGPMFEDLRAGIHPFYMRMGLHYPELAEKLAIALEAKFSEASSYHDIKENTEIVDSVAHWVAMQGYPFDLNLSDLFYAKSNGIPTPHAQTSGNYGCIQNIDFTISDVMPSAVEIIRMHAQRPTSAVVYDFEKAVFHFHRDTERNLYQRSPEGFEHKEPTVAERAAKIGLRIIK